MVVALAAGAQTPAEMAVSGGAGVLAVDEGPWMGHLRLGPEWVPEEGFGFSVDGGWLWFGADPQNGGLTASPSLVYSLGGQGRLTTSLRAGYSLLYREGATHAAHAGLTIDYDVSRSSRFRVEVRDTFIPSAATLHVLEVTFGLVLPLRSS
jgi:hypothetical protein